MTPKYGGKGSVPSMQNKWTSGEAWCLPHRSDGTWTNVLCRSLEQTLAVCTNKGLSLTDSHQVSEDIEALFAQVYLPHSPLYHSTTNVKILSLHNMYDALSFARCTTYKQMTSDCGERSWSHSWQCSRVLPCSVSRSDPCWCWRTICDSRKVK